VVWAIVYPQRGQRTMPTLPGLIVIGLALGIGTAAYNSSSNILFITLSLLLACLVLSGVLSWINFRRVAWRLRSPAPWRVGQEGTVLVEAAKPRARLPSYGLWFEVTARAVEPEERQRAEADPEHRRAGGAGNPGAGGTLASAGAVGVAWSACAGARGDHGVGFQTGASRLSAR
jgi:hypothetical protein